MPGKKELSVGHILSHKGGVKCERIGGWGVVAAYGGYPLLFAENFYSRYMEVRGHAGDLVVGKSFVFHYFYGVFHVLKGVL